MPLRGSRVAALPPKTPRRCLDPEESCVDGAEEQPRSGGVASVTIQIQRKKLSSIDAGHKRTYVRLHLGLGRQLRYVAPCYKFLRRPNASWTNRLIKPYPYWSARWVGVLSSPHAVARRSCSRPEHTMAGGGVRGPHSIASSPDRWRIS